MNKIERKAAKLGKNAAVTDLHHLALTEKGYGSHEERVAACERSMRESLPSTELVGALGYEVTAKLFGVARDSKEWDSAVHAYDAGYRDGLH